jgi:hypothetical protein
MAILDKSLLFSENQAAGTAASVISENVLRFPATGTVMYEGAALPRNLGPGNEIPLFVQVTEAFNTLTSLEVQVVTADNAALSSNPVVLGTSGPVALALLQPGYKFNPRIFPDGVVKEYLGLIYVRVGSNATTGKITAAVATER